MEFVDLVFFAVVVFFLVLIAFCLLLLNWQLREPKEAKKK